MIELGNQTYGILAVAALLSLLPRCAFRTDGALRRRWPRAVWLLALGALALRLVATMVNDDEVAWLTNAWSTAHGEPIRELPTRLLPFRLLLGLGLPASLTILLGRLLIAALAVVCGFIVVALARRIGCPRAISFVVGAIALLWLETWGEMGFLRPEYLALVVFLAGVLCLVNPPARWRRDVALGLALALLTLAATISQRHALYPVAALIAVAVWPPAGLSQVRSLVSGLVGAVIGVLPTVLYFVCTGSFAAIYQAKGPDTLQSGILTFGAPTRWPIILLAGGLAGAWLLWGNRKADAGQAALATLWLAATVAVILNPLRNAYTMCPWFVLSVLATGALASAALKLVDLRAGQRWCVFTLVAVAAAALGSSENIPKVPKFYQPSRIVQEGRAIDPELRLIDWLGEVARSGPVMCVVPCHPVRAANAWPVWDAWVYFLDSHNAELNRRLTAGLADMLQSGTPSVIEWDPWPEKSTCANILRYAEQRGLVPAERLDEIAAALRGRYQLVRWSEPIPAVYGSGRFLVRRDIPLDGRVIAVDGGVVTNWRQEVPPY